MRLWPMNRREAPFFTDDDRRRIVDAIAAAESGTSGEIRVHVEARCRKEPLARARELFDRLWMTRTSLRNGVLIYIAHRDRRFAILGDEAIHVEVGDAYWGGIRALLEERFGRGEFATGVCEAIARVGAVLGRAFPALPGDVNELSNEPSVGEEHSDRTEE